MTQSQPDLNLNTIFYNKLPVTFHNKNEVVEEVEVFIKLSDNYFKSQEEMEILWFKVANMPRSNFPALVLIMSLLVKVHFIVKPKSKSQIQVPNLKTKVQRKRTGTWADNRIQQATTTPPPHY